jgi:hypothetical protein
MFWAHHMVGALSHMICFSICVLGFTYGWRIIWLWTLDYGIVLIAFKYQRGVLMLARSRAESLTTPFFFYQTMGS